MKIARCPRLLIPLAVSYLSTARVPGLHWGFIAAGQDEDGSAPPFTFPIGPVPDPSVNTRRGANAWGSIRWLSHIQPFILADESTGTADYNRLRRAAVLPILPA